MKILRFQDCTELNAHFNSQGNRSDSKTFYLVEGIGTLYKGSLGGGGFIDQANAFSVVFPGDRLFQLSATHGLPLGDALVEIQKATLAVDWTGFIKEARINGWYDFKTVDVVEQALVDCDKHKHAVREIMLRLKCWIMENPL